MSLADPRGTRAHALDGPKGVERTTPFEGTLTFESDEQAAAAYEELDERPNARGFPIGR